MNRTHTTIMIDAEVLDAVKASGVGNFSRYVERLIRVDLRKDTKADKTTEQRVEALTDRLADIDKRWRAYVAREAQRVQG